MKLKSLLLSALTVVIFGLIAGCALFSPTPINPQQAQVQQQVTSQQSQQLTDTVTAAQAILAQLKAVRNTPQSTATTSPTSAPAMAPTADSTTAIINLLTTQVQQLNSQIQNAPTVDAQKQAAFNTGVQTAQAAAVTFGGQYGTLIAAGIGIVSVLLQGMFNANKAHQATVSAQDLAQAAQATAGQMALAAHQTATAAVGAIVGARFPIDGPANAAPK